ncbi:hypothetical protein PT2222_120266 [Paraburkholderia tropica]
MNLSCKKHLKDEGNRDTKSFESLGISCVRIKYRGAVQCMKEPSLILFGIFV